jgi:hypothetical protein
MSNVAQLPGAANCGSTTLPGLIDRARARLAEARSSAEVLEARAAAKAVLEYARLTKATRKAQADCFLIIKYAEMRLVEEVRAAQERGELARHGGVRKSAIKPRTSGLDRAACESGISSRGSGTDPATLDEIGISSQRFAEWRELHDASENAVEAAIQSAVDEDRAPTSAGNQRALMLVAATSIFDHGIRYPPYDYEPADLKCIKGRLAASSRWAGQHPAIGLLR